MRDLLTTIGEIVGAVSVTAGVLLVDVSLGLVVGGSLLIVGCALEGRK